MRASSNNHTRIYVRGVSQRVPKSNNHAVRDCHISHIALRKMRARNAEAHPKKGGNPQEAPQKWRRHFSDNFAVRDTYFAALGFPASVTHTHTFIVGAFFLLSLSLSALRWTIVKTHSYFALNTHQNDKVRDEQCEDARALDREYPCAHSRKWPRKWPWRGLRVFYSIIIAQVFLALANAFHHARRLWAHDASVCVRVAWWRQLKRNQICSVSRGLGNPRPITVYINWL